MSNNLKNNTLNPFAPIKAKQPYMTLSNGLFDEMHENVDTIQYAHAILNTKTKKIIELLPVDTNGEYKVDPVVFALSVDPLADKFPNISPYAYCEWNPVKLTDPNGKESQIPPIIFGTEPILFGTNEIIRVSAKVPTDEMVKTPSQSASPKPINIQRLNAGRQVEAEQLQKMGLNKNTEKITKIDPKTGKEGTGIPDALENGKTYEIKNLGEGQKQSLTKQLRIDEKYSNDNGQSPVLRINKEAGLTKPLENSSFEIQRYSTFPSTNEKMKVDLNNNKEQYK